jgi:predicted RNA-binding Zn-ribbon protein involved in translation (DUF1610 family)
MPNKTIHLPVFDITITLNKDKSVGGGTIISSLKDACPFCKDASCGMTCSHTMEWLSDRDSNLHNTKKGTIHNFQIHKAAWDTLESFILASACAKIDVESPAFLEAIETCVDGIHNNLSNLEEEDSVDLDSITMGNSKQKSILCRSKELAFTCPECGKHQLGSVEQEIATYPVVIIPENGDLEYGDRDSLAGDSQVLAYQCMDCGYELLDNQGNPITDCLMVPQWVKKHSKKK